MSKRVPDNILKLRGTYRPDRHGEEENKPTVDERLPEAPIWLNELAVDEWRRVTRVLDEADVLRATDMVVLAAYCNAYSKLIMRGMDFTATDLCQLRGLCNDLGLTPVARCKLRAPSKKKKSEFDGF